MEIKSGDARPIAILLAVYNGEKYLSEQIDSILDQTNTSWTLYIRNDGSSDGTQRIIDSYLRRFPDRIVQIDRGGANLGCRGNFFRLMETVEADYYMFSDADDVWLPEKIQRSFSLLKQKEQLYERTLIPNDQDCSCSWLHACHADSNCGSAGFSGQLEAMEPTVSDFAWRNNRDRYAPGSGDRYHLSSSPPRGCLRLTVVQSG